MSLWSEDLDRDIIVNELHRVLVDKGLTLAVAESLTAGLLQDMLASRSGSSAYFQGGITAYSIDQKVHLLRVNREMAEACNCVSTDVAVSMAFGASLLFNTHVAIATTGYAEPSPEHGIEHPMAHFAILHTAGTIYTGTVEAQGMNRNEARDFIARYVLAQAVALIRDYGANILEDKA